MSQQSVEQANERHREELAGWAGRALDAWAGGASNPRGVARALVAALDAAVDCSGSDLRGRDAGAPARLLMAQLAFLLGASLDGLGGVESDCGSAGDDESTCERMRDYAHSESAPEDASQRTNDAREGA